MDPIFFLHHCNVDRMLSLWSAVHPGVWVTQGPALNGGSWSIAANSPVDSKTSRSNRFRAIRFILTMYSRAHTFLVLTDRFLEFFRDRADLRTALHLPRVQRS